jgi:hypothetical protein
VVKLEVPIIRLVIKDLITFDGLKLKDEQFSLESEKSKSLEKELKRQKKNTFLWKLGTKQVEYLVYSLQ